MKPTLKSLIRSLPFVAKALGDKMGIKVQISGQTAYTNGDVINIPVLPQDNKRAFVLARGYLDHEAGHVRFTDFNAAKGKSPVVFGFTNAIEDTRIDKLMGETFPGCIKTLTDLTDDMIDDDLMGLPESGKITAFQALSCWMQGKLEHEVLGRDKWAPIVEDAREVLEEFFPEHWFPLLEDLVDEAKLCESTAAVVAHAEKIVKTLEDWMTNPPPPPPPQQNGDQGDDGDDQSSGGSGSGDSSDDSSKGSGQTGGSDDNSGNNDQGDGSDDDSKGSSNGSGQEDDSDDDSDDKSKNSGQSDSSDDDSSDNSSGSGQQGDSDDDSEKNSSGGQGAGSGNGIDQAQVAQTLASILNATEDECKALDRGEALKGALDDLADTTNTQFGIRLPEEEKATPGKIDVSRVRAASAQLRSRLTGLVQASRQDNSFPKRSGRKIEKRALSRIAKNDTRIFQQKHEQTAVNTAVVILLDRSGSMGGAPMEIARDSVLASGLAMEAIPGVSVCTAAFPANGGWSTGIVPLTKFGQSVRSTAKNYGILAGGGTPLTEALYWAGFQLVHRSEPRKIVLVATDGDPNDEEGTKHAIATLRNEGIELLGLGIRHDNIAEYFENHSVVNNLNELSKAVFGMLQAELVRKRA